MVPHALFEKFYYCQTGVKLTLGLREIKSTQGIAKMMKVGYESGNEIDMYVEHFGYDIMELVKLEVNEEHNHNSIEESDDEYYGGDDYEEIENVDFQTEGDESLVIKSIDSHDPFLTKLCSARIMFRGIVEHLQTKEPLADPDDHQIHAVNKLWYMKNEWREVLVYCGRDVKEGRCTGKKIKSLNYEHKCCRNYNLGSLVTFRWIALHFFKEIIEDLFMSLRKMRADIRKKFMIDVSLGQCRRAKQLELFNHEGGLIEHYGRLYQYRQALLDSNPGSTCRLDVEESSNGSATFKRIYICFKGVKDGWLLGCKKVIGAYDYLIKRNPNSWSRAFFEMDRRCAAFENGISKSFNRAILEPRYKPIITMLEEIMLHIMQRLVAMNKIAKNGWSFPVVSKSWKLGKMIKVGVNLQHKACQCRMWELSGVPCVHDVAPYLHCRIEIDLGVSHWGRGRGGSENEASVSGIGGIDEASGGGRGGTGGRGIRGRGMESSVGGEEVVVEGMREEREWEEKNDYFNPANFREDSLEERPFNHPNAKVFIPSIHSQPTQQSGVWVKDTTDVTTDDVDEFPGMETSETTNVAEELAAPAVDKGKGVASVVEQDSAPKKKRGMPPSHIDGVRIYHKNRGRSERIAKMKEKKAFEFDKHGIGSTLDKAFDVSE
uniref:Chloramphenicol acetyltransferase-like domain-containing protein n=1 Tax=Tanacetum cinerariifolium TaxID=118510 RepID=A0A6L2K9T3_TANCI|nr:chloramphenicol acetyltransferase-like domain-containing protein [Tanacetum cinerariifolium]